jgi:hypothetical protein
MLRRSSAAEKATTRQDQAGQTSTGDGAGYRVYRNPDPTTDVEILHLN